MRKLNSSVLGEESPYLISVSLETDGAGVNSSNAAAVLNSLAGKLYYTAATSGQNQLSGLLKIDEGLTTSAIYKNITGYNTTTGQGYYTGSVAAKPKLFKAMALNPVQLAANTEDVYTTPIDMFMDEDREFWEGNGINTYDADTSTRTYTFNNDVRINVDHNNGVVLQTWHSDGNDKTVFNLNGHNMTLGINVPDNPNNSIVSYIIDVNGDDAPIHVDFANAGKIAMHLNRDPQYSDSVNAGIATWGEADVHIENGSGDMARAVTVTSDRPENDNKLVPYVGAAVAGSYSPATLTIDGLVDFSNLSYGLDVYNGTISVGGGKITNTDVAIGSKQFIMDVTPDSSFGYVYFNVNRDKDGHVTGSGKNIAQLEGNISTEDEGANINVGLGTADSYWKGAMTATGTEKADSGLNLYMTPGSSWTNTDVLHPGAAGSSHLKSLHTNGGNIYMQDGRSADIDSYSGSANVYYTLDSTTPTTVVGGDFKVKQADQGSSITAIASAEGTTLAKSDYKTVLQNLASKLWYTAGDGNLTGTVKIAEGLTSSSALMSLGGVKWSESGQGQLDWMPADSQNKAIFNTPIAGTFEADTDYVKAGVRDLTTGTYNFTLPNSTITAENHMVSAGTDGSSIGSVVAGSDSATILELNENNLSITGASSTNAAGITAVGTEGKVEINNAGLVNVNASSYGEGKASALYANGGGQIAIHNGRNDSQRVLTLRADSGNKENAAVISASNGIAEGQSQITVDGLVNVMADGKRTDTAVSSVGSNVTLGGGTITAQNGANAIRAYGDAASDQTGTVTINVQTSRWNPTSAGTQNVQITGDVSTQAPGTGAEGETLNSNGQINIGLNGEDSFWKGNYTTTTGSVVESNTEASNGLNVYLARNADWTGNTAGSTSLFMTGSTTWHGASTSSELGINMRGAATWYNTGDSTVKYFNTPASQWGNYTYGTINMTDEKAGNVTIDNYNAHAYVQYSHDAKDPSIINGGTITIKHAAAQSAIVLSTDNSGIDTENPYAVQSVLTNLAKKLVYTGYIGKAENNLTGTVRIAEGLTSSSAALNTANIQFSEETGAGSLDETTIKPAISFDFPDAQTESSFSQAITGDKSVDTAYLKSGVLNPDTGVYNFTSAVTNIDVGTNSSAGGIWMGGLSNAVSGAIGHKTTINMNRNTLNITEKNETGRESTTGISAIGTGEDFPENIGKVTINNAGNMKIVARGPGQTAGIFANGSGEVYIDNAGTDANGNGYVLTIDSKSKSKQSGVGIKTMNGVKGTSKITITGLVDVVADGAKDEEGYSTNEAVSAVASTIDIGGGNIAAINDASYAIRAYSEYVTNNPGLVYVNVLRDADGNMIGAGNYKTTITGMLDTTGSMYQDGHINVGLNGADSYWEGSYVNNLVGGMKEGGIGGVNLFMKNGAHWKGIANGAITVNMDGANTNWTGFAFDRRRNGGYGPDKHSGTAEGNIPNAITMSNGATWHYALSADQKDWEDNTLVGKVGILTSHGGVIDMTGSTILNINKLATRGYMAVTPSKLIESETENGTTGNLVIDKYDGDSTIIYRRDADHPTDVIGGNVTIAKAEKGSTVTLKTDAAGLGHDTDSVATTLQNLAHKLFYTETTTAADGTTTAADNLSGQVEIAEGLTASSAAMKVTNLTFNKDTTSDTFGQADADTSSIRTVDPTIYYGNYETAMMRGAKSAMLATTMAWQATNNDIQKRLGDLRIGDASTDDGIWAKVGRGRMSYDKNNTNFHSTFTDYYVGYDKKVGNSNWRLGAAFSKLDGKDHYERGSHGDSDVYAGYVYAFQMRPDNSYIDIVGRVGHLKNEYSVYNDSGNKLRGDYSTNGFALSAEYGKRFQNDNGFYVEPQAEVIWSKLASKDYDAHSDYNGGDDLHINQHTYNSFIGRLGLGIGVKKDRFSAYAKASLLHEFDGGFNTDYTADGYATKSTHMDFGDTWVAMDLGTTVALSDRTNLFGYFERTFGSDIRTDWRYNVGLRFSF